MKRRKFTRTFIPNVRSKDPKLALLLLPALFFSWQVNSEMHCGYDGEMEVCVVYGDPPPPPPDIPPVDEPEPGDGDDNDDGGGGSGGNSNNNEPAEHPDREECWENITGYSVPYVTKDWGWRQKSNGTWDFHPAWDIGVNRERGHAAESIANVTILETGYDGNNGNYIEMEVNGSGEFIKYIHLDSIASGVNEGEHFRTGDTLGVVGDTGKADGIHLHVTIWESIALYESRWSGDQHANKYYNSVRPEDFFDSRVCGMGNQVSNNNDSYNPPSGSTPNIKNNIELYVEEWKWKS